MANQDAGTENLTEQFMSLDIIALPTGIIKPGKSKVELSAPELNLDRLEIGQYLLNESNKVLFLGEGNFTFSAAVALFRGTWNNIIPSEKFLIKAATDYNKLFRKMIDEMAAHEDTTDSDFRVYVENLVRLEEKDWKPREVDAQNLTETWGSEDKPNTLFFQCPWVREVWTLISNFFESAKHFQKKDDLLFLSICTDSFYVSRYNLKSEYDGYELLGADDSFCKTMFARGYQHQTGYDSSGCHKKLAPNHLNSFVTLCYRKTCAATATPSTQASDVN